jgi:hypothetical protein
MIRKWIVVSVAVLGFGATANAAVVYSENFDSGTAMGFSMNSLWHVTSNFPDSLSSAQGYVQDETQPGAVLDGNYSTGSRSAGAATSPLIALPTSSGITLSLNAVNFGEVSNLFDVLNISLLDSSSAILRVLASTSLSDGAATFFPP